MRRKPSGLPIPQNATTDFPASRSSGDELPSPSIRSSGACRASTQCSGPACRSASARIAARSAAPIRSARDRTTTSRTPQRSNRLAEQPSGKQRPEPERLECVEQDHIQIARQPPMLKSVVEHDQLGLELEGGDPRQRHPIGVLKMGNVGQVLLEDPALVVESLDLPVAAAQDRDPHPAPAKPPREPLDHRGLTRSAQRQVPHRNHRHAGAMWLRSQPRS